MVIKKLGYFTAKGRSIEVVCIKQSLLCGLNIADEGIPCIEVYSAISKFIWKGRILKVDLNELKNEHISGGLNLPCIKTMNDALLSSQCLRLLRRVTESPLILLTYGWAHCWRS